MQLVQVETTMGSKVAEILKIPNERLTHGIDIKEHCFEDNSGKDSTQLLQMQKNQPVDLRDHFERF